MSENNHYPRILEEILQELEIAKKERQKILAKLENIEKFITPEMEIKKNIKEPKINKQLLIKIDYQPLQEMLQTKNWLEADQETAKIMLLLTNQEKKGYLTETDIYKLPAQDLITLDEMWLTASNNKFGFSVQNKLYQNFGGKRYFEPEIWRKFGENVGWYQEDKWLKYDQLNFSNNAPLGHLPVMGDGLIWFVGGWEGSFKAFSTLLLKLIQFNII